MSSFQFNIKSINICSWYKGGFSDKEKCLLSLNYAKYLGCNYVTLDFVLNFKDDGTMVEPEDPKSLHANWNDLEWMVNEAHTMGLSVILKPHTTLEGSSHNRNDSNTNANLFSAKNFFVGMNSYLATLSTVASQLNVEVLSIGTEFETMDTKNRNDWLDLISNVREKYDGKVTYDSHLIGAEEVVFLDALDFISASMYVRLSENDNSPKDELINAFVDSKYYSYPSVIDHFASLSRKYNIPIVALEAGYDVYEGGLGIKGFGSAIGRKINYDTQAKGIEAYLEAFEYYGASWFAGVSFWGMTPDEFLPSIKNNTATSILIWDCFGIQSTDLIRSYYTGITKALEIHSISLDNSNHYLGIGASSAVILNDVPSVVMGVKISSRILNSNTPSIDIFIDDLKAFTFKPAANARLGYVDSRGYSWTDVQNFEFSVPSVFSKLSLRLSPLSDESDLYNVSIKNITINHSSQDLTEDVVHKGQSSVFSSSITKGSTQLIDISNYLESLKSPTIIYGGKSIDTIDASSFNSEIKISYNDSIKVVTLDAIQNNLHKYIEGYDIERIKLANTSFALDLSGNAGTTVKILGAVFGKQSIKNKTYVGLGLSFLDSGWTYDNLAALAINVAGAKSNDQIVSLLWSNVIGTKPTTTEKEPFIALLENGMNAGALVHLAADSSFNITNINLVGLIQTGIEFAPT